MEVTDSSQPINWLIYNWIDSLSSLIYTTWAQDPTQNCLNVCGKTATCLVATGLSTIFWSGSHPSPGCCVCCGDPCTILQPGISRSRAATLRGPAHLAYEHLNSRDNWALETPAAEHLIHAKHPGYFHQTRGGAVVASVAMGHNLPVSKYPLDVAWSAQLLPDTCTMAATLSRGNFYNFISLLLAIKMIYIQ